jgi:GNAT superfamily N-acetyltransferase
MEKPCANPVNIRPAVPEDLDSLVALLTELFALEADFTSDIDRQRRGLMLMLRPDERRTVQVADIDGHVVGMATAQGVISTAEGGEAAWVEDVVVAAPFRGQGIGRRLLHALEGWARMRGISRLQLVADRDNHAAKACYDQCGWQATHLECLRRTLSPEE